MAASEPGYVAETLAWCNKMRKQDGKKPLKKLPKGLQDRADSCPCGEATGLYVYEDQAERFRPPDEEHRFGRTIYFNVPRAVGRFVRAFDKGKLPQYIKKGS